MYLFYVGPMSLKSTSFYAGLKGCGSTYWTYFDIFAASLPKLSAYTTALTYALVMLTFPPLIPFLDTSGGVCEGSCDAEDEAGE